MLESQTDKVYFFQSRWLVFHLQCHYSLTEQLCATLVMAPSGDSRGALGVACGPVYTHSLQNSPVSFILIFLT